MLNGSIGQSKSNLGDEGAVNNGILMGKWAS